MQAEIQEEETEKPEEVLLPPSQQQSDAIDFIVDAISKKIPVVGLIAPGGCGKTFSLKHIAKDKRLAGKPITFTATTNKAATVMKAEGITKAKTLHSAISIHVSTKMFASVKALFASEKENPDIVHIFPKNVLEFLKEIGVKQEDFFSYSDEKELIAENKVDSYDDRVFSHYTTGEHKGGTVFIDESSMLPTKSQYKKDFQTQELRLKTIGLDVVQKVFDTVILVGDDSQLPPINGTSSFHDIEKVSLTENHRSDKGLLRVLDHARRGENLANFVPEEGENVTVVAALSEDYFDREALISNNVTHIVYKNNTRKHITHKIRNGMSSEPSVDEPLVYKGANIDNPGDCISKNETGFFNGFMGQWENHRQVVQGRNFDEYGTGFTYMQYGYAITCHTSQGSSFDYVVIHIDDIPHFIDSETRRKWTYTAVSRARKGIVIVY